MTANTLISSIAIHHVVYERKRELYAEIDGLPKDPLHLDQTAACRGILFTLREELLVTSQPSLTREGSFDCAYRFALANRHASLRMTKCVWLRSVPPNPRLRAFPAYRRCPASSFSDAQLPARLLQSF